jgi:transcriptional regulator with XRE-family HTH domain
MDENSLGERLAAVRKAAGYEKNQVAFAKLYGLGKTTWSGYENNKTSPAANLVAKICRDCGINPRWLILGEGKMKSREDMSEIIAQLGKLSASDLAELQVVLAKIQRSRINNPD